MFDIGIKGLVAIVTRALNMFGWGFLIKKRRRGALKKISSGHRTTPFRSRC